MTPTDVWRVWQLPRSITATSFLRSSSHVHDRNRCLRRQVRNDERPWVQMQLLLLSRSSSSLEHTLRALPMSSLYELQVASGISAFPTTREEYQHFKAYHSDKTSCLRIIMITIAHEQYEDKCTWYMKHNIPCNSYDNHLHSNWPYTLNVEQPVVAFVLCECVYVCNADLHTDRKCCGTLSAAARYAAHGHHVSRSQKMRQFLVERNGTVNAHATFSNSPWRLAKKTRPVTVTKSKRIYVYRFIHIAL